MNHAGDPIDPVEAQIRSLLGREQLRMTPTDLVRALKRRLPATNRQVLKSAITRLVNAGTLAYTHHFSSSQLELNSSGVVRVSTRLALNSNLHQSLDLPGCLEIKMQSGSAFGRGDHPTTRLALQAVDRITAKLVDDKNNIAPRTALDIGCGTGVLAIAAAKLGIAPSIGVDIDLTACHEATGNVRLNHLAGNVHIVAGTLDALKPARYDIIMANLRPPTLARLMPVMQKLTADSGYWILSGFRPEEMEVLQWQLPQGFLTIWKGCERNWGAFTVQCGRGG